LEPEGFTAVFGMGTGVSHQGFKGAVGAISESLDTTIPTSYCIADIHRDVLIIVGFAVKIDSVGEC